MLQKRPEHFVAGDRSTLAAAKGCQSLFSFVQPELLGVLLFTGIQRRDETAHQARAILRRQLTSFGFELGKIFAQTGTLRPARNQRQRYNFAVLSSFSRSETIGWTT